MRQVMASFMMVPRMTCGVAVHKTRSDLLSLWWDSSALPGLEPQDRTTTSRRGQAQPLAGDRCAATLATRVDDGSHVGGFCVREKFFGDSPNPIYGHI